MMRLTKVLVGVPGVDGGMQNVDTDELNSVLLFCLSSCSGLASSSHISCGHLHLIDLLV